MVRFPWQLPLSSAFIITTALEITLAQHLAITQSGHARICRPRVLNSGRTNMAANNERFQFHSVPQRDVFASIRSKSKEQAELFEKWWEKRRWYVYRLSNNHPATLCTSIPCTCTHTHTGGCNHTWGLTCSLITSYSKSTKWKHLFR